MAGRLSARLLVIERRLRPVVRSGISEVILSVPRRELAELGEPCPTHADCSVRRIGLIGTHLQGMEDCPRCD